MQADFTKNMAYFPFFHDIYHLVTPTVKASEIVQILELEMPVKVTIINISL